MRPLQLSMQAFGPYAQRVELDFTQLGDQNIFVIAGPTGAGKTTIFDGMCYALYGRATGERSEKGLRSDFVQEEERRITEVCFRFAVRDKVYEIYRRPAQRLPKERGQGFKDGVHEATLRCIGHEEFAPLSRLNEVAEKIQEILGLDYEQFRKIVMIPQGEFRRFLTAPTGEKQQILRQLFGTELFERLQKELADHGRQLERQYKERKNQLALEFKRIHLNGNQELEQAIQNGNTENILTVLEQHLAQRSIQLAEQEAQNDVWTAQQERLQRELEKAGKLQEQFSQLADKRRWQEDLLRQKSAMEDKQRLLDGAEQASRLEPLAESCKQQEQQMDRQKKDFLQQQKKMQQMEQRREKNQQQVQAADQLTELQERLTAAQENRETLLKQYNGINRYLESLKKYQVQQKQLQELQQAVETQQQHIHQLRQKQRQFLGASLAADLQEGMPCPVCGATHHPALNKERGIGVADSVLQQAEDKLEVLRKQYQESLSDASIVKGQLEQRQQTLEEELGPHSTAEWMERKKEIYNEGIALKAQIEERQKEQQQCLLMLGWKMLPDDWKVQIVQLRQQIEQAQREYHTLAGGLKASEQHLAQMQEQLKGQQAVWQEAWQNHFPSENAYQRARQSLEQMAGLREQCSNYNAAVKTAAEEIAAYELALRGKQPVEIEKLQSQLKKLSGEIENGTKAYQKLSLEQEQDGQILAEGKAAMTAMQDLAQQYTMVQRLAKLANGENDWRMSFETYVLVTYFLQVLEQANRRLLKMTGGRYYFLRHCEAEDKRKAAGLDLDIMDNFTGRSRAVSSLSGGEGFKASLALALGLSDVVQSTSGGIELNTIFIDEGFGTLDHDSLENTIGCLLELQQHGRLVGVISHVAELKEQIPAWLVVESSEKGSNAYFQLREA